MENLIVRYYQQEIKKLVDKFSEILEEDQYKYLLEYFIGELSNRLEKLVMPNEVVAGGHRQIRFYCKECGKELFEDIELEDIVHLRNTIKDMLFYTNECSDCSMKKIKASQREA